MKVDVLMHNSNELNAAYAADGYARFRHGLGVVATTYVHRAFAIWFHLQCRFLVSGWASSLQSTVSQDVST